MHVEKRFFPSVTLDNEEVFFSKIIGVIESVDELSSLEISKTPNSYHFRIAPSLPKYSNLILQEILKLHNLFSIKLDLSKSIKTSGVLNFTIDIY